MGTIMAVCVSPRKGTPKNNIGTGRLIAGWGLEHDSYAGSRHRQVSLLSYEKIEAFRARGAEVEFGAFGENLVVRGFDFAALPVGARFACGGYKYVGFSADLRHIPCLCMTYRNGGVFL